MITPNTNTTTMRSSIRKRVEDSSRGTSSNFGQRYTSLRVGMVRNLIAVCFLISMALASNAEPCYCKGEECEARSFKLTTQKSSFVNKLVGYYLSAVSMWKNTSTIEVRYHPTRRHVNWCGNNHKFEKVNGWWKANEWFTITKMLEHDKENNRIHVQIHGMTNRWIYYLEHDAVDFIENLRNVEVNLGHKRRQLDPIVRGSVKGLPCPSCNPDGELKEAGNDSGCEACNGTRFMPIPTREELKRGDADNGVYGFRVALNKEGCLQGTLEETLFGKLKKWSLMREFFDAVSVRVYLKDDKVDFIEIPNALRPLQANITKIDLFNSDEKTVILRLKDNPGYKYMNFMENSAADRKLFLGGEEIIGMEGKKLLKFLVDHAGDYANDITDDSGFTEFVAGIDGDWDPRPAADSSIDLPQRRRLVDRLASHESAYVK